MGVIYLKLKLEHRQKKNYWKPIDTFINLCIFDRALELKLCSQSPWSSAPLLIRCLQSHVLLNLMCKSKDYTL